MLRVRHRKKEMDGLEELDRLMDEWIDSWMDRWMDD
jgi:hypothetical protein